ncbi:hypothetical protein HQ520_13325, partial [bacterium]|nr:hypothetical protein [bacterium]
MNFVHKTVALIPLAFVLVVAAALGEGKADLSVYAPEETLLFLQARDVAELSGAWEKTPFHAMYTGSEFEMFFKPLKDQLASKWQSLSDNAGTSAEELKDLFPGQVAVFLSELIYKLGENEILYFEINTGFMG